MIVAWGTGVVSRFRERRCDWHAARSLLRMPSASVRDSSGSAPPTEQGNGPLQVHPQVPCRDTCRGESRPRSLRIGTSGGLGRTRRRTYWGASSGGRGGDAFARRPGPVPSFFPPVRAARIHRPASRNGARPTIMTKPKAAATTEAMGRTTSGPTYAKIIIGGSLARRRQTRSSVRDSAMSRSSAVSRSMSLVCRSDDRQGARSLPGDGDGMTPGRGLSAGVGELAEVVRQGVEDQGHVGLAGDVVVGLEAAVGQEEDVLGVEPGGQGGDGGAVVGVGAGGLEAGGLPEDVRGRSRASSAIKRRGAAALVDALLARLLDEGLEATRQGGRVESVEARPARRSGGGGTVRGRGSARPRARLTLPAPSRARRAAWAGSSAIPCSRRTAASSASGSGSNRTTRHRETIVSSCASADVPIRIRTEPGGGSSRVFRKALAASSFRSSASSTIATLRVPRARLHAEVDAEVADDLDRQLVLVLGASDLQEVGVGARLDLEATGADAARVERAARRPARRAGPGRRSARRSRLPIPSGPTNRNACGSRPCARLSRRLSTTRS